MIPTLEWTDAGVRFLDQTKLPLEETYVLAEDYRAVAEVIRTMIVRGAPAIGVSAAMGVALGLQRSQAADLNQLDADLQIICDTLAATRPTAVNPFLGDLNESASWCASCRRNPAPPSRRFSRQPSRSSPHVRRRHRRLPLHGCLRRRAYASLRWCP